VKHEKSCGAIVLRRDKENKERRFLLVIRQYHGGPVSFPKGHVEEGETEQQTAEREVFEETAVRISIDCDFREKITYSPSKGVVKDVIYFLAETEQREIYARPGEIAEVFWIDVRRADRVLEHDNDKNVLKLALAYLDSVGETEKEFSPAYK